MFMLVRCRRVGGIYVCVGYTYLLTYSWVWMRMGGGVMKMWEGVADGGGGRRGYTHLCAT